MLNRPQAPGPRPQAPGVENDAAEYRRDLGEAYAAIVAQETAAPDAPSVDVEAAASIDIPGHRSVQAALAYFTTGLRDSIQTSQAMKIDIRASPLLKCT